MENLPPVGWCPEPWLSHLSKGKVGQVEHGSWSPPGSDLGNTRSPSSLTTSPWCWKAGDTCLNRVNQKRPSARFVNATVHHSSVDLSALPIPGPWVQSKKDWACLPHLVFKGVAGPRARCSSSPNLLRKPALSFTPALGSSVLSATRPLPHQSLLQKRLLFRVSTFHTIVSMGCSLTGKCPIWLRISIYSRRIRGILLDGPSYLYVGRAASCRWPRVAEMGSKGKKPASSSTVSWFSHQLGLFGFLLPTGETHLGPKFTDRDPTLRKLKAWRQNPQEEEENGLSSPRQALWTFCLVIGTCPHKSEC